MINLHWTEVDHVTTVWTEAPSPLRAGLLFRTGRADETLVTAGQTHLIEHLSFAAVRDNPQQHNGFVGGIMTGFYTLGRDKDISKILSGVCDALTSLPGERLEDEKQILAAEIASRRYDFRSTLLTRRYGAAGYGLLGLAEFGLSRATLEQLKEYAAQRFTSDNAILWLSGPVPKDLRLNLPRGAKLAIPDLITVQPTLPSWYVDNRCGGVAAGTIVPRSYAALIFCEIASRRLRKQLRSDQAVSYAPLVFYDVLDADVAHLVLYADSEQSHRVELAKIFGELFQGLGEINEADLEESRSHILEQLVGSLAPPVADQMLMMVHRAAMDWIMGKEFEPLETSVAQYQSVTLEDVIEFARDLQTKAMFALPGGMPQTDCFGEHASVSKWPVVQGRKVEKIDAPIRREKLVYGSDGISIIFVDGSHLTARYSDLAAVLYYEDGAICLVGMDATNVLVEPTLWRDGKSICSQIRQQVPAQLVIDRGSRPANAIPKPSTTFWQRLLAKMTQR